MNPAVPTKLKILRGNPGKRRIRKEPEPLVVTDAPKAPRILKGDALDEWKRVTAELQRIGMLTIVDLHPLAAYCDAFGRWMTASDTLRAMAKDDPIYKGLMVRGSVNNLVQNPLIKVIERAAHDMVRYAAEFGFTPVARTRLASDTSAPPGKAPTNKFLGLIAS